MTTTTTDNTQNVQEEKEHIYLVTYNVKTPEGPHNYTTITERQSSTRVKSTSTFLFNIHSNTFNNNKPFFTILKEDGVAISVRKENIIDIQVKDITEESLKEGFQIRCPNCNTVAYLQDGASSLNGGSHCHVSLTEYSVDAHGEFMSASGYKLRCPGCKHSVKTYGRFSLGGCAFAHYIKDEESKGDNTLQLTPYYIDAKGAENIKPLTLIDGTHEFIRNALIYFHKKSNIKDYQVYGLIKKSEKDILRFEDIQTFRIVDVIFGEHTVHVHPPLKQFVLDLDGEHTTVDAKNVSIVAQMEHGLYNIIL